MSKWITIVAVALNVAACSKDKPPETAGMQRTGETETTQSWQGGSQAGQVGQPSQTSQASQPAPGTGTTSTQTPVATVEEIRAFMVQERPNDSDIIRGLVIDENGGIVTIRGRVYDEQMKSELTGAAKKARGVRDVKNDVEVDKSMSPKTAEAREKGPEQIRAAMLRERPNQSDVIGTLTITEQGNAILLRGTVPDEDTKMKLGDAAKKASAGKDIKNELQVKKK
jgi:osmotically-inducible protein OsmY